MKAFRKVAVPALVTSLLISTAITGIWTFTVPVVIFMKPVDVVVHTGSHVIGEFIGFKLRDCSPILGSERGLIKINGVWYEDIPFEFVDDQSPGSSKPPRMRSHFGWWEWKTEAQPTQAMMQIDHLCGSNQFTSNFGPLDVINQ